MKTFKEFLVEFGGESAGKMEIINTPPRKAFSKAEKEFEKNGRKLSTEIPDFVQNFAKVKKMVALGHLKRKDMPVINTIDVRIFQARLKMGTIDFRPPFAPETNASNPFPTGLKGVYAKKFLSAGLLIHDGDKDDDKVNVSLKKLTVGKLKPLQNQIYFDRAISLTAAMGTKKTIDFITKSIFITSKDNFIIDGHHRYLSGVLIDPNMQIKVLSIDLPIKMLLPLTLTYGDSIGNKRNK